MVESCWFLIGDCGFRIEENIFNIIVINLKGGCRNFEFLIVNGDVSYIKVIVVFIRWICDYGGVGYIWMFWCIFEGEWIGVCFGI